VFGSVPPTDTVLGVADEVQGPLRSVAPNVPLVKFDPKFAITVDEVEPEVNVTLLTGFHE
jgi:hypothetical protein